LFVNRDAYGLPLASRRNGNRCPQPVQGWRAITTASRCWGSCRGIGVLSGSFWSVIVADEAEVIIPIGGSGIACRHDLAIILDGDGVGIIIATTAVRKRAEIGENAARV
jgi:hypothetical protein